MIRVDRIKIVNFRGIRDLTIDLNGANFAVCGPNGTGKSGVVDALEFGLSGNISRLTGKGQGSVSVKDHGPHVNTRTHPEKAVVTLDITIPSLGGKKATITRNVKSPKAPTIAPPDADVLAVLEQAQQHPEFCLSRREIIKYVLAEPGVRATEVQALLQLDKLETARGLLVKIYNSAARELKPLEGVKTSSADNLMRALGIAELKMSALLEAVNAKRTALDLAPLAKLEATTSIRDGLETLAVAAATKVPKSQAKIDIAAIRLTLDAIGTEERKAERSAAVAELKALKADEAKLTDVARDALLASALTLFDDEHCPVCQTEWNPDAFRAVVAAQRDALQQAADLRKAVERMLEPFTKELEALPQQIEHLTTYAKLLPVPLDATPLAELHREIKRRTIVIREFLPLDNTIEVLDTEIGEIVTAKDFLTSLLANVDFLTVGQERLETWRQAMTKHSAASRKSEIASRALEIFGATTTKALETIYKDVEAEFRSYYRDINHDDESKFEAQLTPSLGKLGFEVDFYGKGFFPPGAYHSEGHQDGMGLCLYLALMKHLLGDQFTFAVLDDVLMSVDAGHRREVCALLKTKFPNTQFVLTTHDNVWLNHMKTSKLIRSKSAITFRKWHVDHGPAEWKQTDVWSEIDDAVAKNEIRAAAGQLRHYLEYAAAEWSAHLGGRVEYRSDGKYELGDLLPAAIGAMNEVYKKAKAAAGSWGDKARVEELGKDHDAFGAAVTASESEQWEINPAVHYNEWANFQREDFKPVVDAFRRLEKLFECKTCADLIYVVKTGKTKESARCSCNTVNINLKVKPKEAAAA
jgi:recombinational DNA repair ATPase RecF